MAAPYRPRFRRIAETGAFVTPVCFHGRYRRRAYPHGLAVGISIANPRVHLAQAHRCEAERENAAALLTNRRGSYKIFYNITKSVDEDKYAALFIQRAAGRCKAVERASEYHLPSCLLKRVFPE